ncbi:ABC transporter substrate-binding protein [Streptomyces cylindrosporus]|uniref:ABC transporter substrate-binding protein n=1 Tax=Streptomyces cylindrosporus TaxID=2927583 RepID=A0ABS9XY44_9ACTN|nr:ABC transporter substrate-binding protein [Streptomyces cylindrosporus]MCI3269877.1 ABC transporter substrate-binding protein [Streptomyces cylindrosporus]
MRRRILGLATAVVTAAGAAACGSSPADTSGASASGSGRTTQVKVGIVPIVDVAPLYLGRKKGFFADRGIELKTESAQGGAAIVPGVVSGQFQFGFSNTTSLMIAQTKGIQVTSVANGDATTGNTTTDVSGVAVKKDSPIKSAKDLAGRTVAVNTLQNIGDTTVREAVRKDGGDPSKIKFVELAFDQMPAAVSSGQVDAAWMAEPALTIAKAQGDRVVTSPFAETDPKLTLTAYFTSTRLTKSDPELVKNFAAAMTESLKYADAHPDEARQAVTTYTKIDATVLKDLTLPSWPTEYDMASLEKLARLGEQDGIFGDKKPDLKTLFR